MGNWFTHRTELNGGILENSSPLEQGINRPGSLTTGLNVEPSQDGGYSTVLGHEKFNTTQSPAGAVEIQEVAEYKGSILAFAANKLYQVIPGATPWAVAFTDAALTGILDVDHTTNTFGITPQKIFVTGVKSFHWSDTGSGLLDPIVDKATSVVTFHNRTWFAVGPEVFATGFNLIGTASGDFLSAFRMLDDILDMAVWRDALYVFGKNFITKITGFDDTDIKIEQVSTRLGVVARHTIQEVAGDLLFLAPDGIRTIAGTDKIGDTALDNLSVNVSKRVNALRLEGPNLNLRSVSLSEKGQYRVYASATNEPTQTTIGILAGLRASQSGQLAWEFSDLKGMKPRSMSSANFGTEERMFFGTYDGFIQVQKNTSHSFDSTVIVWEIEMPYWVLTIDDPELRKVLFKFKLYADTPADTNGILSYRLNYLGDQTISPLSQQIAGVGLIQLYDSGVLWNEAGFIYSSSEGSVSLHNVMGSCQNVSFRISGSGQTSPHTFKSITLQFSVEGKI